MTTALNFVGALLDEPEWRAMSACLDLPFDAFFPTRGESVEPAKAVCATCPVIIECREYALANVLREGVYGGMSEKERRYERRQRRRESAGLAREPKPIVDPVAIAEARLGAVIAPAYRSAALWPRRRAPRRSPLRLSA